MTCKCLLNNSFVDVFSFSICAFVISAHAGVGIRFVVRFWAYVCVFMHVCVSMDVFLLLLQPEAVVGGQKVRCNLHV